MLDTSNNTSNDNGNRSNNEEVGALWKRVSRNGMTYLAGHLKYENLPTNESTAKVVVFSNDHKQNDKQPDYRVYLSKAPSQQPTERTPEVVETTTETAEDLM